MKSDKTRSLLKILMKQPVNIAHLLGFKDMTDLHNQWLKELKENQRSFVPFNLNTENLKDCLTDIMPKSGFMKSPLDYKKIMSAMNAASQKAVKTSRFGANEVPYKLFCLLNETLDKLIEEKYISVN